MTTLTGGEFFEYVVVGAGIEGSWSAYQLLRALQGQGQGKARVLLLEQFFLPHTRGSSSGQSRIIRHGYADLFQAQLIPTAYQEWLQLEKEVGEKLIIPTDLLVIADKDGYYEVDARIKSLRTMFPGEEGSKFRELTPELLAELYPAAHFNSQYRGYVESSAGILRADRCLATVQQAFCRAGGILRDGVPVTALQPPSTPGQPALLECMVHKVKVTLNAGHVVVCAGPWTAKLLDPLLDNKLPLTVIRTPIYFWRVKESGPGYIKASFIDLTNPKEEFWGLPEHEYPGLVKFSTHFSELVDPDTRDKNSSAADHATLPEYISEHFPGLEITPAIKEGCMYTMTPDSVMIVDHLPGHANIVFACGFSGSGFKKAPVVGRMITQLLKLTASSEFDMKPFTLKRFNA